MKVSFSPESLAEVEDATRRYLDNGGMTPSRAFAQELKRVVALATENPRMASSDAFGISRLYFKRFPYTLIFRIQDESLRIIAVAHQSRRPRYWVGRR